MSTDIGGDLENELQSYLASKKIPDIFKDLGNADLTAHVDFYALKQVCYQNNLKNILLARQGDFLKSLGIDLRLQRLVAANPSDAKALIGQYNYLLKDMGTLFKALSVNNF
jgi:SAM-dependent MidA family methyltransferase